MCLFTSCSKEKMTTGQAPTGVGGSPTTDPVTETGDLQALVQNFEQTYNVSVNYSVGFETASYMNGGNSSVTVIGVCEIYSNGYQRVLINQDWWATSSATADAKKVLVFHELGHCQFRRAHDTRTYAGGRPYSIMYPMIDAIMPYYLAGYQNYYINELVNPIAGAPTFKTQLSLTYADGSCQTFNH